MVKKTVKVKKTLNIIYFALIFILVLIASLSILSVLQIPRQYRIFVVQSSSMKPFIKRGSLIFLKKASKYKKGEIITYKMSDKADIKDPRLTITHRIVKVTSNKKDIYYETKGDANNISDLYPVNKKLILGKVVYIIPYLGYPVGYAKTQTGFILLIVIPATLIVYAELMSIKKEALRLIRERKNRKLTMKEKIEERVGEEVIALEKEVKKDVKKVFDKKKIS